VHDLDIVLSLVRSPLREVRAVGIPILSSKVDIANARLEFDSGCVANFTASRVSTERVRKLRLFQPHQYVSLDYSRQDVFALTVEAAKAGDPMPAAAAQFPAMPLPTGMRITPSRPQIATEEPLHAELRSFIDAVRTRRQPAVTLADGRRVLDVALQILAQIAEHSQRANLAAMAPRA
jgi:predicted dehydrogenase